MNQQTTTLLLHTCCAPCLMGSKPVIEKTAADNTIDITCFWYNPNIHPYTEYKSRRDALIEYTEKNKINLIVRDYYGLVEFTKNVIDTIDNPDKRDKRCGYCYETRLKETAKYASENEFDMFSSTLLVSPYQNHERLKETGEKYAREFGVKFFYADFRVNFREGQKAARENNVYLQKYCGCIFSEQERYLKDLKIKNTPEI